MSLPRFYVFSCVALLVALLLFVPASAVAQPMTAPPPVVSDPTAVVALPTATIPVDLDLSTDDIETALREAEAEIALLAEPASSSVVPDWPDLAPLADLPPIRTVMHPADRSIPVLTTMLRHTTLLLPPEESIVDYVVGDSAYFDLRGADNVAYVKAMGDRRRTQVTLVTNMNRAYSFDIFAVSDFRPDEVLTIRWPSDPAEQGSALVPGFDPSSLQIDFAPSGIVDQYRDRIRSAEADALRVTEDAASEEARIRELGFTRFEEFLESYPQRVQFRYRLSSELRAAPLFVTQLWTDGTFTYMRSRSQESPALYSLTGVEGDDPVLVNVTLRPDGLYVVDHVLAAGYAQLQGSRGDWFLWDVPPLAMLSEMPLPRGDQGPDWVRTRRSLSWVKRHPRLFGMLLAGGVGTATLVKILR